MQRLVTFDPGGTTGWCIFVRTLGIPKWSLQSFGQFETDRLTRIPEIIQPFDIVLHEQIQVLHLGFDPIGLQVIGALKLWCALEGNKLLSQTPGILAGAKAWPELDSARKWFRRQQHAKDAFYHGVTYIGLIHFDTTRSPKSSP